MFVFERLGPGTKHMSKGEALGQIVSINSVYPPTSFRYATLSKLLFTGQHFYRLIVHNTGSCPSLMLASFEPETQKSTAALVGLKAVSDPLQFFNLQSSAASVLEQRSTSSLPTGTNSI